MFYSINGSHPFVFQNLKYIYIIKINKKFPKKTTRRLGTNWTPFKAKTYTLEGKEEGGEKGGKKREEGFRRLLQYSEYGLSQIMANFNKKYQYQLD